MKYRIFANILCPIDIYDPPLKSIGFVRQLLGSQPDLNVHFLYINQFIPVVQYPQQMVQPVYDGSIVPGQSKDELLVLNELIAEYFAPTVILFSYVDSGSVVRLIHQYAAKLRNDLIVLEMHRRDVSLNLIAPSIPLNVLRTSSCPVMIVQ